MVVLNQGKASELTLRMVLESELHGREYFDNHDSLSEMVEALGRLVENASDEAARDGIERAVSIAVVPKTNYGDDSGYGFGLGNTCREASLRNSRSRGDP